MDLSKYFATAADLARVAGVSREAARHWMAGRVRVPAERCLAIETATGGAVTRYELRPDVFGSAPDSEEPRHAA